MPGFVARHAGGIACVVVGTMVLVAAILRSERSDWFALGLATLGTFLVAFGAAHHRVREAELSGGGMRMKLDPMARETVELFEAPDESARRGEQLELQPDDVVGEVRFLLAQDVLSRMLRPTEGPLGHCTLHLYLYDADSDQLVTVSAPGIPEAADSWDIGQGATGTAYELGQFVLVEGRAVSDDTYGLTPEQQARYSDLSAVAAMPVATASGDVVGVLTVATDDPHHRLASPEAFDDLVVRAEKVARVLVDLLRWFDEE